LGGTSEREFLEKVIEAKQNASKAVNDIRNDFAKMEKLKADSLKKIEEMRRSAEEKLEKLEVKAAKSEDIVTESRRRINMEIMQAKNEILQKYDEIKTRISASILP